MEPLPVSSWFTSAPKQFEHNVAPWTSATVSVSFCFGWEWETVEALNRPQGVRLSWNNLREQFGQEYKSSKDFKRELRNMLKQVCAVYPEARISEVIGGIHLYYSPAPLSPTRISLSGIASKRPVDN